MQKAKEIGMEDKLSENTHEKGKSSMSLRKELLGIFVLLLALLLFIFMSQRVLTPKRFDFGATWDMYLKEEENSIDVLFYGSSLTYCDISPAVIYDETGITSYVMAGPEQTIPITYFYLLESLKTQSPKTVFIEASSLLSAKNNRSLKVNITYMPFGKNRLDATFGEALPDEIPGLLFPLYAYHDRWDELKREDFRIALTGYDRDPLAGYTFLDRTEPMTGVTAREIDEEDKAENYGRNLSFAGKIVELCEERGIRPIFFISPTLNRIGEEDLLKIEEDILSLGAEFIDFDREFDEVGFDLSRDFYDNRHTNYRGAEKFSRYLGGRMLSLGIPAAEDADASLWEERMSHFSDLSAQASAKDSGKEGGDS